MIKRINLIFKNNYFQKNNYYLIKVYLYEKFLIRKLYCFNV